MELILGEIYQNNDNRVTTNDFRMKYNYINQGAANTNIGNTICI